MEFDNHTVAVPEDKFEIEAFPFSKEAIKMC